MPPPLPDEVLSSKIEWMMIGERLELK